MKEYEDQLKEINQKNKVELNGTTFMYTHNSMYIYTHVPVDIEYLWCLYMN